MDSKKRTKTYRITNYTRTQARKHGVTVKRSTNPDKKIDVFNATGRKIASVGAVGYADYPTFMATRGKTYARRRRRLYKIRHQKDRTRRNTAGYWADKLLW